MLSKELLYHLGDYIAGLLDFSGTMETVKVSFISIILLFQDLIWLRYIYIIFNHWALGSGIEYFIPFLKQKFASR